MPGQRSAGHQELLRIVRGIRRRWRLRVALHGAAIVLAGAIVTLLAASYGMQLFAFSTTAITACRVVSYVLIAALVVRFLVLPQLRSVSDEQIALYVEEHEPTLDAVLVSAVEMDATTSPASGARSSALAARVLRDAVERVHGVADGRRIERGSLRVASAIIAVALGVGLFAAATGPAFIRHGVSALLRPWRAPELATPYRLLVRPGNVVLARGADQTISARLEGFSSGHVDLLLRTGKDAAFQRVPMTADDSGAFQAMLFKLERSTEYFVEASGVRSPLFRIDVADLPYTRRLDIEYEFPAYTGLPSKTVEDGGDIAALKGTLARLRVWTTLPSGAGRIVLGDGSSRPLTPAPDGTLGGSIPVEQPGSYHIELQAADGSAVSGSPDYTIDVLADQPPSVAFEKPGRDIGATSIEEVFLQARAVDDFGVEHLDLVYSVNGGAEKQAQLYTPKGRGLKHVSAGHTLYLEDMGLHPGDLLSYYARVADGHPGKAQSAVSDIYFIRIRDFRKDYHAADQRGMPGGGQDQPGALSEREREVIAATFNLKRDKPTLAPKDWQEHRATIALAQGQLRQDVETLNRRMRERGVVSVDSTFGRIMEILPRAIAAMKQAEERLTAADPEGALPPEQQALQHLQQAEEIYRDVQVALSSSGGGGGSPSAQDLADLFQLEMDKLGNQYETVQRSREQDTQAQLDATLERLKELAHRQQQAAERQRRLAQAGRSAASAGGEQRKLADQVEQESRRLERLARENPQQNGGLNEAARQLRDAADALRRSAADASGAGARTAAQRLEQARRLLERNRQDRLTQGAADASRRADELAQEQRSIAKQVEALGSTPGSASRDRVQQLMQRKDALADGVDELEHRLDRLAAGAQAEQRQAAKKLADAAKSMRDEKIEDKIRFSKGVMQGASADYKRRFENEITSNLDDVRRQLADAAQSVAKAEANTQGAQDALDGARALTQGMQSLGQRMQDGTESRGGAPRFSPGDVRQFRGEAQQRLGDARALEQELRRQGRDVTGLQRTMGAMRRLTGAQPYQDAAGAQRLEAQVVQGLKEFEFSLRRQILGTDDENARLSGGGEVPPSFRKMVDEYFRAIGHGKEH